MSEASAPAPAPAPAAPIMAPVSSPVPIADVVTPASGSLKQDSGNNGGGFADSIEAAFKEMSGVAAAADTHEMSDAEFEDRVNPKAKVARKAPAKNAAPKAADPNFAELDALEETNDWTPQAAKRFKDLKNDLRSYRSKAETLEAQIQQREARLAELEAAANNPEIEAFKSKAQQYEQHMLINDLEKSTAYQNMINKPLTAIVKESNAIATKYGVNGKVLLDIIATKNEQVQEERLSEVMAKASDRDKFRLYKLIETAKPVFERRQMLKQNAAAALKEAQHLDMVREQQSAAESSSRRFKAATVVGEKLKTKLSFLKNLSGADFDTIAKEAAGTNPAVLDDVTASYQVFTAKLFPKLAKEYVQLQRELEGMANKLAEFDRAKPRVGGGAAQSGGGPTLANGASFLDAVATAFGG